MAAPEPRQLGLIGLCLLKGKTIAPKVNGLFPLSGMQAAVEKLKAIYAKAGASENFTGAFYDVPHRFSIPMQEEAIAFLTGI